MTLPTVDAIRIDLKAEQRSREGLPFQIGMSNPPLCSKGPDLDFEHERVQHLGINRGAVLQNLCRHFVNS